MNTCVYVSYTSIHIHTHIQDSKINISLPDLNYEKIFFAYITDMLSAARATLATH